MATTFHTTIGSTTESLWWSSTLVCAKESFYWKKERERGKKTRLPLAFFPSCLERRRHFHFPNVSLAKHIRTCHAPDCRITDPPTLIHLDYINSEWGGGRDGGPVRAIGNEKEAAESNFRVRASDGARVTGYLSAVSYIFYFKNTRKMETSLLTLASPTHICSHFTRLLFEFYSPNE